MDILKEINKCLNCKIPGCMKGCPANNNIPLFIKLAKENKINDAYKVILERNNISPISCLVCDYERQCMGHCNLAKVSNPVNIPKIEEYINNKKTYNQPISFDKKIKVAAIGSGPSSLSFAFECAKNGIKVDIYEKENHFGGLLTYGIPNFRLDISKVERYINNLKSYGINLINKNVNIEDLKKEYDYLYVGVGLDLSRGLEIENSNNEYVIDALKFLHDFNLYDKYKEGKLPNINGSVLVIGGGNVAIDAARCLKRMNLNVTIVYRRSKKDMRANNKEIEDAINEGINIITLRKPKKVILNNNSLKGVSFEIIELGEIGPDNKPNMISTGKEEIINCNYVISAIGQASNKTIDIHQYDNDSHILYGGDINLGASTVIAAATDGKNKAKELVKLIQEQN